MGSRRALRIAKLALVSGVLGLLVVSLSNALAGEDRVANLSEVIGLRSGAVLGGAIGALLGAWLGLGGSRRIASLTGLLAGLLALVIVVRALRPHAWILDTVMEGIFGENGGAYSPALVVFILILAWRPLTRWVSNGVQAILQQSGSHPGLVSTDPPSSLPPDS